MTSETKLSFGGGDVVVFGGSLMVCGIVGIYFAVRDRNNKNVENYYFGGRHMSPIAVGISLSLTYVSGLTVIALPTESYLYGTVAIWFCLTSLPGIAISSIYFIPMLHRLQVKTLYQLVYMSFTIYAPALALSAVTPISLHWSILLTSGLCTFYTTLGGVKAVVWTDVIQCLVMFCGLFGALVKAIVTVGGFESIWNALDRSGRLNFFEANPNPTLRDTMWTIIIGSSVSEAANVCVNQSVCQRFLSCKSVTDARRAAVATIFPKLVLTIFASVSGCVAYAYFEGCDPLGSGLITKQDQMFPYLVLKVFRELPGMAGLFVAAAYAGTMSTVSSGLNCLSSQLLQDFLLPFQPNLGEEFQKGFGLAAVIFLGVASTFMAYMIVFLDETVFSMILSLKGSVSGAIMGVYILGMFFPWCNTKGAAIGQLTGAGISLWLALGAIVYGRSPETQRELPLSTMCCKSTDFLCTSANLTVYNRTFVELEEINSSKTQEVTPLYALSYWYNAILAVLVTIVIGLIVSFITGANQPSRSDPKLFCPIFDNQMLPRKVRRFSRFGVPVFLDSSRESLNNRREEEQNHAGLNLLPSSEIFTAHKR